MNDATKQKTTAEAGEVRAEGTDNAQLEKLRATWKPPGTVHCTVRRSWRITASGPPAKSRNTAATPNCL